MQYSTGSRIIYWVVHTAAFIKVSGVLLYFRSSTAYLLHWELATLRQTVLVGVLIRYMWGSNKPSQTHLVCPIRCTRPIAWYSWARLRTGSTRRTCVASIRLRPLAPLCIGNSKTRAALSVLKECRLSWKADCKSTRNITQDRKHQVLKGYWHQILT